MAALWIARAASEARNTIIAARSCGQPTCADRSLGTPRGSGVSMIVGRTHPR
jgi:hypothetical protein